MVLMSDNGSRLISSYMKEFANTCGFEHVTGSPYHSQSNGLCKSTVKIIKSLLEHANDPYLALLSYGSTLLSHLN